MKDFIESGFAQLWHSEKVFSDLINQNQYNTHCKSIDLFGSESNLIEFISKEFI